MLPLVGVALACATGVRAAVRVAVVIDKPQKALEAAAKAISEDPRVQVERFDLSKGTLEGDRLVESIEKKRFQGIVALGREAHELVTEEARGTPFASTFVGGLDVGENAVPELPSPDSWAEVLASLLPKGAKVATIDSAGKLGSYLNQLRASLRTRGMDLMVHRVPAGKSVSSRAGSILGTSQGFFFPRTRELLNRTAAVAILKGAGSAKVPVFAFSASLLKAGATASLDIPPAMLGRRAVNQLLGEGGDTAAPRLRLNLDRAKLLGLSVTPGMRKRAGK
jgi:hypothetical protein